MQIFGIDPIALTALISVTGVGIQVGLGILQSEAGFDYKKLVSSAIIGLFTAIAIVGPAISAIPEGADSLMVFLSVAGLVAAVAGIDILVKNAGKSILAKAKG